MRVNAVHGRNVGTAKDGGRIAPTGIPRLDESTMLQTDLRGDTPAARQRFTDRRRDHEFAT
jgi:hypothetical protein